MRDGIFYGRQRHRIVKMKSICAMCPNILLVHRYLFYLVKGRHFSEKLQIWTLRPKNIQQAYFHCYHKICKFGNNDQLGYTDTSRSFLTFPFIFCESVKYHFHSKICLLSEILLKRKKKLWGRPTSISLQRHLGFKWEGSRLI